MEETKARVIYDESLRVQVVANAIERRLLKHSEIGASFGVSGGAVSAWIKRDATYEAALDLVAAERTGASLELPLEQGGNGRITIGDRITDLEEEVAAASRVLVTAVGLMSPAQVVAFTLAQARLGNPGAA